MCKHKHVTKVQCVSDEGWFVAEQCDMCGLLTQDFVPFDESAGKLPNIDLAAYQAELARRVGKLIASMEKKL